MEPLNIVMTGTVTPHESSPLATAPIKPDREVATSEKYQQGDDKTARLPRMAKYFEETASLAYTPYFPAAGIRGAIRRAARDSVFSFVKDEKWGLELHRLLTIGGVSTAGPEGSINISAIQAFRERNPLISLFGATSGPNNPWIEGRLSVGHAMPSRSFVPPIVTGIRTDPVRRKPSEITMLNETSAAALDDICNASRTVSRLKKQIEECNSEIKKAKKNGDETTLKEKSEQVAHLTEQMKQATDLAGTSVSVQMPLSGYETIPPLMPLNQRIVGQDLTLPELGLLVMALRRFAKKPLLGAHQAHGCGIVRCEWGVSIGDVKGKILLEPFVDMIVEGDQLRVLLAEAEDQFKSSMENCTEQALLPA
jgi:CRISPR type IV-associated protein Csf2